MSSNILFIYQTKFNSSATHDPSIVFLTGVRFPEEIIRNILHSPHEVIRSTETSDELLAIEHEFRGFLLHD